MSTITVPDRIERVLQLARERAATASRDAVRRKLSALHTPSVPSVPPTVPDRSHDEPARVTARPELPLFPVLRSILRAFGFLAFITGCIARQSVALLVSPRAREPRARAGWLQRTARGCAWLLGLRVAAGNTLPARGLLVANHLGYLDIILLASLRPCVFVSKAEVRRWPIFGICARLGGTIFVDRSRRAAVAEVSEQMRAALAADVLLVLFPEGTSSGGTSVLPFKSSLVEPALRLACPVTPAALGYRLEGGSVTDEICYWREMTLLPHLLNVFSKPQIEARVACGVPRPRNGDRKTLARELHDEVAALHQRLARELRVGSRESAEQLVPVARTRFPTAAEPQHA